MLCKSRFPDHLSFEEVRTFTTRLMRNQVNLDIQQMIDKIMACQVQYERNVQHPNNVERLNLLSTLSQEILNSIGPTFGASNSLHPISSDVSRGVGGSPKIAWCRFTDKNRSKSAQRGLYIVLLFSEGGESCFLSLNQGTDGIEGGVRNLLKKRVVTARQLLGSSALSGLELVIDLNTSVERGRNYELGHICGYRYLKSALPTHDEFISNLENLLALLTTAYTNEKLIMNSSPHPNPEQQLSNDDDPIEQLAKDLSWSKAQTAEMIEALCGKKRQVILGGPPGTGKTFAAEKIANFLVGNPDYVEVVQFHPSYGYEDFVEGLRPSPLPNGGFEFKRSPGVIPKLSALIDGDEDTEGDDHARVLIIDEINRANIARVFGELMYLLEYRDKSIRLMLDGREFSLPSNLIIIGTMNTADRSTRSLDIAMRRRFSFFELLPDVEILKKFYLDPSNKNELGQELFNGFETLNNKLRNDLDKHFMVGHSYFMNTEMNAKRLRTIWSQEVFPLIEEYFFDNDDRTAEYSINSFWPSV
jgi:MoxR-like ATPase